MSSRRQFLKLSALGTASFAAPAAYSMSDVTMTYNTGNPVPSKDHRDLLDNAASFDIRVTSRTERSTPDRLGVMRKTWYGIEQDFAEFLAASGFEPAHLVYQPGVALQVDRPTQLVDYGGSMYRVKMPASFPVTLAGNWAADSSLLVDVGDAALRAEIGDAVVRYESMAAFLSSPVARVKTGRAIYVSGYSAPGDGGAGTWLISSAALFNSAFVFELSDGRFANLVDRVVSPLQIGYSLNADNMSSVAAVASNWAKMKAFLLGLRAESWRTMVSLRPSMTLRDVCAEWLAGRPCPIGFYSDSTTDGATTTGHIPSTGSDSPFAVTINESPNAYPAKVEEYLKLIIGSSRPVRCYNGGFDSQSFYNGFGLKHWYNTWFRGLAGSNVNWSDVKMIVIGFGTSDSINKNNPGQVIDAYAIDVECVIVDCLLRGVTPVLQGPVLTTQKVGTSVNYRNGDESITLIETMQLRLCQQYGLEHLSYRDEVERMLSGYSGMNYLDYMSPDMVHPTDMGHRVHAGYLISRLFPNLARLKEGSDIEHLFAGHNAYIPTFTEVVSPPSQGGLILKNVAAVKSDDRFFYSWRAVDGNAKTASALLVRLPVYVDKPTNLYMNDGSTAPPAARQFQITSCTLGGIFGSSIAEDAHSQPARTYNKRRLLARLPFGLNIINWYAGGTGGDYQFVSSYLVDALRDPHTIPPRRPAAGSGVYAYQTIQGYDVPVPYVERAERAAIRPWDYYNMHDNVPLLMRFDLLATPSGTYGVRTHYQDYTNWRDCYNQISITGDTVSLSVVTDGVSTEVDSQEIPGLGALMVAGARVQLRYTTRFASSLGVLVELLVNGAVKYTHSAALGVLWPDGYGFGSFNMARTGEVITSARAIPIMTDVRFFV